MGRTFPNPAVAAVVVRAQHSVAQFFTGFTEPPGGRHAEVVALDEYDADQPTLKLDLARGNGPEHVPSAASGLAQEAIMVVTLEPCSRQGRTPPCTRRIIGSPAIVGVGIGVDDPNLSGEGWQQLRNSGRKVRRSALAGRLAGHFLAGFVSRTRGNGPRLHLKAALTHDGLMARTGDPQRFSISGPEARSIGMLLRAKLDAVVVGPGTAALDLPALDLRTESWAADLPEKVKSVYGRDLLFDTWLQHSNAMRELAREQRAYQPLRICLLGRSFAGQEEFFLAQQRLARSTGRDCVYFVTGGEAPRGVDAMRLPALDAPDFGKALRGALAELGCNEVLVEGGPGLFHALRDELRKSDRLVLLRSKQRVAGPGRISGGARIHRFGTTLPDYLLDWKAHARYDLGSDTMSVHTRGN